MRITSFSDLYIKITIRNIDSLNGKSKVADTLHRELSYERFQLESKRRESGVQTVDMKTQHP